MSRKRARKAPAAAPRERHGPPPVPERADERARPESDRRRRHPPLAAAAALERPWACALVLAALCVILVGAGHGVDGKELDEGYDWAENFSFQRDFIYEAAERREAPLWCPYTFGGRPFYADPQTQAFYPVTLLWLAVPKMTAFTLDVLLHYFLAAFFGFLFTRSLDVRPAFALLAGALYSFSGFNLHHIAAGHVNFHAAVAWLPLAFWCVERAIQGRRASWLWGGGVLGLQFLAGSIPVSWMTFLFAGLYGVVRGAVPFEARRFARAVAGLALIVTLGVGIAAVQLIPTAEFASLGVRSPRSYEYSTYRDLPPRNLVNLVFPQGKIKVPEVPEAKELIPEGEYNGYIGMLALGLGMTGMTLLWRRGVPALAAMALLALPLMLGHSTPLFRLFWWIVPGVSALRFHCREVLVLSFALVTSAAVAAEEFARVPWRERQLDQSLWIGGGALAAAAGASILYLFGNPTAPPWQIGFILLTFPALWLARRQASTGAVAAGLLLFAFIDVTTNALHFDTYYAQVRAPAPPTEQSIGQTLRKDGGLFRGFFHKRAYRRERYITDRFEGVDGYEAIIPRRYYEFIHAMCNTTIKDYLVAEATQDMFYKRSTPFPFRVLNVKYTTLVQEDRTGDARETHVRYRMLVNPDPDPRAYLAQEAAVGRDDTAATALLKSPQFDPRRTAILDADPPSGIPRTTVPPPPAPPAVLGARSLSADGRVSTTEAGRCELVSGD